MNNIEQSIELIASGRDKITRSKHLILLHKFHNHSGINAINKAIEKVMNYKIGGIWVNTYYQGQYNELTAMRQRIIDKDFAELKPYFELGKK